MIPTTTNNVNARLQKASYRLPDYVSAYQSELTEVGEEHNYLHFDVNRPIIIEYWGYQSCLSTYHQI